MVKAQFVRAAGRIFPAIAAILFFCSPAAAASDVIELKFANFFPPPSRHSKICEEFIHDVQTRTNGRIKIRYFPGGSILKAPAIFKGVESGIADIGYAPIVYTPGRMPVSEACMMPLGYPSAWVSCQVANDFYHEFKPKEWDQVQVLWMHASNPNVIISKKPIRTLEDFRGVILRAPGRVGDAIRALGGTPAPTPMMETYDAIAKNVIHGVNAPFETLKTFRFAEVAKHVTASWQVGNIFYFFVVMNKDSYEKIPPDLRLTFDRLCGEYKERIALMWNLIDIEGKEYALDKGVQIIQLPEEEMQRWKAKTASVTDAFIQEMIGKGYPEADVRSWFSYLEERIRYWTRKQIDTRLTSATGPEEMRQ